MSESSPLDDLHHPSIYEKLYHIPSSCIVLMVHVKKVVNIVQATFIDAGTSITEMESETDSRPQ